MLLAFIPTLIALIDILKSRFNQNDKLVWIVVVLFFNLIGAIMYFTIGRKQKIKVELEK
ncbi:PLD nuclease N-terminal domain-containing protein [Nonlabens sp. MB-3u-79]